MTDGTEEGRAKRVRAAFDRLARKVAISVTLTVLTLLATLVYLIFALLAANAAGPDVLLFATLAAALTAAACGALAPMVRHTAMLRQEVGRLEERVEKLAERQWELREAEERARSFIETQGDLIVRRDAENRITYANDAFCRLAGRGSELLLGTPWAPAVHEQGDVSLLPDGSRAYDQHVAGADGPRWIAWREALVRGAGGGETQSVGRDITERVRAGHALAEARDHADAANFAKGRLLAMASHEIRTPLNGILGMADLLLDTELTPEQRTYAKAVKASGDTLLSLVEEVLDFSKLEAGKLALDPRPFDLTALIEETVELIAPRADAKGIDIACFVDESLPRRLVGDAARLRQIVLNLAGNAVKFTEIGGVTIVAERGARPEEIALHVSDTGIGIAADAQARIFEDFEQVDGGATRKFGGTGLGLAISRRIVERMDGRIEVASAPGSGSTFSVRLDLPRADDQGPPPAVPELAQAAILVVAERRIAAGLLARRLAAWGAIPTVLTDPASAQVPSREWDAVIAERGLGLAALQAAATARAPRRILLVRPGDRRELAALMQTGFTDYLVKPVRVASLAARFGAGASADAAGAPALPTAVPQGAGRAVLIAEDNEINALLARALLARLGHRASVARDGAEAVEAWRRAQAAGVPYDLVLMDVHMPGMDGLEAARRIRALEQDARTATTPIIALSANVSAADRDACLAAGMNGFLTKPLEREQLAAVLADPGGAASLAA